jgi:hypothetical protein
MDGFSVTILEREKEKVSRMANDLAHSYLNNIRLINSFTVEERKLSDSYISDYKYGKLQFSDAMRKLQDQYSSLYKTYVDLKMGSAKLYAIAERRKEQNSVLNIVLKQVGFVSGGLQMIGGGGICVASVGLACGSLGVPLIAHGAENAWENGYYLALRKESSYIPLRQAYRETAKLLGGTEKHGDIAYSVGDLSLSAGTMFKYGLQPDAWKLFYYIKEDYIIGWKTMGAAGLTSELVGDSAVGLSLYQLMNNDSSDWSDLSEKK